MDWIRTFNHDIHPPPNWRVYLLINIAAAGRQFPQTGVWLSDDGGDWSLEDLEHLHHAFVGSSVFIAGGRYGIGPSYIQKDDVCIKLPGSDQALLLRPVSTTTYKLVGVGLLDAVSDPINVEICIV
ncbi:hypothetical protein N7493_011088 [Penicillium malachiteum]|uniref:Uncharacterized protein n=1 Tax=Penicillium malachiteum TaxID=1324776 RepID=A0AAD6HBH7_9EURO|nr:hypothetical protein N7493_011088 [Penicillium malachiteum]